MTQEPRSLSACHGDALAHTISHLHAALRIADEATLTVLGAKISEALDFAQEQLAGVESTAPAFDQSQPPA